MSFGPGFPPGWTTMASAAKDTALETARKRKQRWLRGLSSKRTLDASKLRPGP